MYGDYAIYKGKIYRYLVDDKYIFTFDEARALDEFEEIDHEGERLYIKSIDDDFTDIDMIFSIDVYPYLLIDGEKYYCYGGFKDDINEIPEDEYGNIKGEFSVGAKLPGWKIIDRNESMKMLTLKEFDGFIKEVEYIYMDGEYSEDPYEDPNRYVEEDISLKEFIEIHKKYDPID